LSFKPDCLSNLTGFGNLSGLENGEKLFFAADAGTPPLITATFPCNFMGYGLYRLSFKPDCLSNLTGFGNLSGLENDENYFLLPMPAPRP
jgi:hypothetical protein